MSLRFARVFSLFVGALALSACGENGATSLSSGESGQSSSAVGGVKTQDLLYVSNSKDGSVDVYSYPQGKLKGRLLNVKASALCSDGNGDVYVPQGNEILKYAHGGTRPIAVLDNPLGGVTQFCAVDSTTGNLAVSGGASRNYGVAIYTNARGNPKIYAALGVYRSLTYDSTGNLFIASAAGGSEAAANLVELPKGATQVREILWNGTRPWRIGAIQWDGKFLATETSTSASGPATLVRYSISARQASLVGRTSLTEAGSPLQFWIYGTHVIVPTQSSSGAGVMLYRYPEGAEPFQIVQDNGRPQAVTISPAQPTQIAVTTYHYDNYRSGWDSDESSLTYGNVNSGSFGLLQTVTLDDQVDTQPLLVPNETTTTGVDPGQHDVLYVTTESDTVYAIDASSGTILFQVSLGTPVPYPLGCNNNGPNVGIDGTPVIDTTANAMYVIAYTLQGSTPTYYIHELNLSNLTDVISPVLITASHTLTNGKAYTFNASVQRQRPALLEADGNIYAGFGSFCDFAGSQSRGWLLGWQTGSLTPLAANRLNDTRSRSSNDFFLSSIWMSGGGIAADPSGNVYFVTGNSDYSGTSYNSVTNISETVAEVSSNLTQLLTFFTPSDVGQLDQGDVDFGSGGVLLLPEAPGSSEPPLAAAAGKEGTLFLLDRQNMGGHHSSKNKVLDQENVGGCWCTESYFDAATDSTPRIVGSGGNTMTVWKVPTSGREKLTLDGLSPYLPGGQDPGFFTAVSSNGSSPGAIIWAVARPEYVPGNITLFAFEAQPPNSSSTLQTLYQAPAGYWASTGGNANIVPVVANGKVYVASYEQLDIFGLLGSKTKAVAAAPVIKAPHANIGAPHQITGTLVAVRGSRIALRTRTGALVAVDDSLAVRHERSALLVVGEPFNASGAYDSAGVLHAVVILRAKRSQGTWTADR